MRLLQPSVFDQVRPNGSHSRPCPWGRRLCWVFLVGAFTSTTPLRAQLSDASPDVGYLKKLSIEDLMEVKVTSVSKYPARLLDAASAIQVISNEDIRRSGFATIADSLRLADNLNVAQKNPHDWAVSARGFNANVGDKLLVLMDGRSVYTPLFSGVFWNSQDYLLADLDRIEVISGPGGTLWGANAVNGVINITTKNARDTVGTYVEAGGGNELQSFAGARYGGALGANAFFRVYGKFFSVDESALATGVDASNAWRQAQAGFRVDATPTADDTFTVQGDYYNGTLDIQSGGAARIGGGNLMAHWSRQLPADSTLTAKIYYDRTHLRDPFAASPFQPAGVLIDDLDTYDLDLQHRFWIGQRHQVVWGAEYRRTEDRVKQQAPNFGFFPPELTQELFGFFAQDEIKVTEAAFVTVGSKVEHNDYTGWEVEPNIRFRLELAPKQTLWAAVSRAVRTPSRFDRDLAEPSIPPVLIGGSKSFASETVVATELGYRAEFSRSVSGSISLFYNQFDDLRGLAPTPITTLPLFWRNSLEATTYGAELAFDFQVTPSWRLHAGYTHLEEDVRIKAGRTDLQNALGETADPADQFTIRSAIDLRGGFELDAMYRWVDGFVTNNFSTPGTVPSYGELNLRLGWRPSEAWELSIVGQNLLHARHSEYGFPTAGREELQRGVYGKAVWRF
ncbi:MAG: TonB-dependent receptor [Opitutus sp.]